MHNPSLKKLFDATIQLSLMPAMTIVSHCFNAMQKWPVRSCHTLAKILQFQILGDAKNVHIREAFSGCLFVSLVGRISATRMNEPFKRCAYTTCERLLLIDNLADWLLVPFLQPNFVCNLSCQETRVKNLLEQKLSQREKEVPVLCIGHRCAVLQNFMKGF